MIRFEGWSGNGGSGVIPASHKTKHPDSYALLTDGCELIWTCDIEGLDDDPEGAWTECMKAWHRFNGWEPYVPPEI